MNCPMCQRGGPCETNAEFGFMAGSVRPGHLFRAYAAAPLGVERDAKGRVWCQLFPLETWHRSDFPGGKLELTSDLMAAFIANWRAAGAPALPVDYEHEEQGPASGWIEDLRLGPTGELQGAIAWTDEAAADIKADRRRYLSPTWAMQHTDRRSGAKGGAWLYGAALTNSPFFDSMPRVAASAAPTTHQPTDAREGQEQHMDKKRICAALGLPEETEDEKVMEALEAACKSHASAPVDAEKLTAAVKAKDDTEAKLTAAQGEVEKLRASILERDVEALVVSGKAAGKALDPMREYVMQAARAGGLEAAQKFVAAFPVTVPLKAEGEPVKADAAAPLDVTAALAKVEKLVEEHIKAGNKATVAYRLVAAAHPELAALTFPTTSTTR